MGPAQQPWRLTPERTPGARERPWSLSSAPIAASAAYSHRFTAPGTVGYYCQLHPFMRGRIDAHALLLNAPREAAAPGRPLVLTGRAALPAGSTVRIEADGDGAQAASATTATVEASGAFRATVTPRTTTSFRALAAGQASPPVPVLVLDRRVTATARSHGRRGVVDATVLPASPGATVVLQLRLRERFGWWPVRKAKIGRDSRAHFRLRLRRPVRARVLLTLADGATPLAVSPTLRLGRH